MTGLAGEALAATVGLWWRECSVVDTFQPEHYLRQKAREIKTKLADFAVPAHAALIVSPSWNPMAHLHQIDMPPFHGRPPLSLTCIESSPFAENSYVLARTDLGVCVVFDPGFEPDAIIRVIEQDNLSPQAILLTHGHSDHIAGNAALKERWPELPILVGESEAGKLGDPEKNLSRGFGLDLISPPADATLRDRERFALAGFQFEVHEIPGHSSGHVAFLVWPEEASDGPPMVFAGDILFRGSIGRTDFPDGSFPVLASGIRERLYPLPEASLVLPGHGEPTTIGRERVSNPYVNALDDGPN